MLAFQTQFVSHDGLKHVLPFFSPERWPSEEHYKHCYCGTPYVNLSVVFLPFNHFWRHEHRSPHCAFKLLLVSKMLCESEVSQLYTYIVISANIIYQNIFRLYISMCYSQMMHIAKSVE